MDKQRKVAEKEYRKLRTVDERLRVCETFCNIDVSVKNQQQVKTMLDGINSELTSKAATLALKEELRQLDEQQ